MASSFALAVASAPACDARRIYADVRAATGGSGWNRVSEITSTGTIASDGFRGTFRRATDVKDGRSAFSAELGILRTADVYDGHVDWRQDYSGGVHAADSPNARAAAITQAFLNRNGYYLSHLAAGRSASLRTTRC